MLPIQVQWLLKKQDICMNTTNLEKFPRLQHHECSKNSTSNLKANFNVVWNYILPSEGSPSWVQTTIASAVFHEWWHTVPHWLFKQISTRPSVGFCLPWSLISPSWQTKIGLNIIHYIKQTNKQTIKPKTHPNCTRVLLLWLSQLGILSTYLEHTGSAANSWRWVWNLFASNWHVNPLSSILFCSSWMTVCI